MSFLFKVCLWKRTTPRGFINNAYECVLAEIFIMWKQKHIVNKIQGWYMWLTREGRLQRKFVSLSTVTACFGTFEILFHCLLLYTHNTINFSLLRTQKYTQINSCLHMYERLTFTSVILLAKSKIFFSAHNTVHLMEIQNFHKTITNL